ncbi:hypothetical protein BSK66_29375 [Paenibacillus odorifer]|uniref:hypothetical protein n=1 Tax=unclassified Paenibacillus TaxID=185978 RepID=UPI0003E2A401|nr:hypothetical protein [Paenibacillus sp. FSL H8-237]ETT67436.1 hypothetical protein C171_03535 [Paenibacillus sp. FSL H8-237]OME47979.1 hypothetical protein BSK66_29375 [Paenibacillus odorifer]
MSCSCSGPAAVTGAPIAKPGIIRKYQEHELQLLGEAAGAGVPIAKPDIIRKHQERELQLLGADRRHRRADRKAGHHPEVPGI